MPTDTTEELVQQLNDAGVITIASFDSTLLLCFASGRNFVIAHEGVWEQTEPTNLGTPLGTC